MDVYAPRRDRLSLVYGRAALIDPDGHHEWIDDEFIPNTLADEGEKSMIDVYLTAAANPNKYLGLLNDSGIAETDTLSTMVESITPGASGYARQQILTTDWAGAALVSGDYESAAAEKTFGAASGSAWTCTHAFLGTAASSTSGLFLCYVPLSSTTTVAIGQQLKYTLRWKMS
jgi:hypothetical protein